MPSMYDKGLLVDILQDILNSLESVLRRFRVIQSSDDFVKDVDWKRAMGMRDIIAHHYFDIDHEIVYAACMERIPSMKKVVERILDDLKKTNEM
jgi:hypothetical protein